MEFFLDLPASGSAAFVDDAKSGRQYLRVQAFPIREKPLTHKLGELFFDKKFAEQVVRNFRAYPGEVPADYNHGTEKNGATPEEGAASGWVRDLRIEDDGVYAYVEPTDRAVALVKAKEYRFSSPTVHFDWLNPETGKPQGPTMLSLALTNRPFIRGMAPVEIVTFSDLYTSSTAKGAHMDPQQTPTPETPAPEAAPATIALADHEAAVVVLKDQLASLTDRATKAEAAVAELNDKLLARDVKDDVDAAERAGKITPANREKFAQLRATNPALFADIVASLPVVVKLGAAGLDAPPAPPVLDHAQKGAALVEAAEKIAKEEGLSYRDSLLVARNRHPELASGF